MTKAVVYKDGFRPSRPWQADLHFDDGKVWPRWQWDYRTLKAIKRAIRAVDIKIQISQ